MDILGVLASIKHYSECVVTFFALALLSVIVTAFFNKKKSLNTEGFERLIPGKVAILFAFLGVIIACVILAYLNKFKDFVFSDDPAVWGQAGDFFGGMLNPILAFASFIALLYTIKLQSKEMAETREEMSLSRAVQEDAASAAKSQLTLQKDLSEYTMLRDLFAKEIEQIETIFHTPFGTYGIRIANVFDIILNNTGGSHTQISAVLSNNDNLSNLLNSAHALNFLFSIENAVTSSKGLSIAARQLNLDGDFNSYSGLIRKLAGYIAISTFIPKAGIANATTDNVYLNACITDWFENLSITLSSSLDTPPN